MWQPQLDPGRPRFLAIADALGDDVTSGRLPGGERLPTHRDLAGTLGLSVGTVTRAYAEAEKRGLIHSEVGRGTFVRSATQGPFAWFGLGDRPPSFVDLSMSWPCYEHDPDLGATLKRIARRADVDTLMRYQSNSGMSRHRAIGSQWLRGFGLSVDPTRVMVCAGAQHALQVLLSSLAGPGDIVLAEDLTYPGIKVAADLMGVKLVGVPLDEEGIRVDALEDLCKRKQPKALYTIPCIQNPTTGTLSLKRRKAIAEIAERYGMAIMEDDVHRLLDDDAPPPISSFVPEQGYYIGSLSKAISGGIRVAFLAVPSRSIERIERAIWATLWMVSPLCAEVACTWIEDGSAELTVAKKRAEARARTDATRERFGGNLRCRPSGYHSWLQLPEQWQAPAFAEEARKRGVGVTPADAFFIGSGTPPHAVRISMSAARSLETLNIGLDRLAGLLEEAPGLGSPIV